MIVGIASGDPLDAHGSSGIPLHLFDALERRGLLAGRAGVVLGRGQTVLARATTFSPGYRRWRRRYHRRAFAVQSRNADAALRAFASPYELALQVFRGFQLTAAPYALYLDTTAKLTRTWADWTPFDEDELGEAVERRLYDGARHIFTMGGATARSLGADYGVPPERVTVVGGGVNLDRFPEATSDLRDPVILFVGRDFRRKGGDVLVEAFARVRERLPEARLQLVGAEVAANAPGVEVLGRIGDRARLASLYANAAVFCLPSRFEPYGLVLVEAMAYGLPCVGTSIGAMPEIVSDGETGLLVPPEDDRALAAALLRLLKDRGYARRLGAAGRSRAERELTWDRVVDRMMPVLERLR